MRSSLDTMHGLWVINQLLPMNSTELGETKSSSALKNNIFFQPQPQKGWGYSSFISLTVLPK